MLEAKERAKALFAVRSALGGVIAELRSLAEEKMGRRVSINRAIFADCVEAGCVGAEGQ